MTIEENMNNVLAKIQRAANKSNRNLDAIKLIAVTKTIDVHTIREVLDRGIIHIGENKVQEFIMKYEEIGPEAKWHIIGHLQRNKVKYIIDKVDLIHSVDSIRLAREINKRAKDINKIINCLIQVNISNEETKYGINPKEIEAFINEINNLENIKVKGLMTLAPYAEDQEESRKYFKALKLLSEDINEMNLENINMKYLSMGMSNDFEVAIEEGANIVRIGSAIFGDRDYNK